ncbi:MAG: hypothetical protein AAFX56_08740 [Pseudomonadota bacterium]
MTIRGAFTPCTLTLALLALAAAASPHAVSAAPLDAIEAPLAPKAYEPMAVEVRSAVEQLVILPSDAAANEAITGSYDKAEPGLIAGVDQGRHAGTVTTEVGPVNVRVPIPILQLPGMVWGGLSGAAKKDIQEFRDALTEDIVNADSQPLANSALALDVHRNIRSQAAIDAKLLASVPSIPETTDAVLYVGFDDFKMDVDGKNATLILSASASLTRRSDNTVLYSRTIEYQDTDTLKNWTKDDLALWRDYTNFAGHYLARELAGETFYRRLMPVSLSPEPTSSAKRHRKLASRFVTDSLTPELAWKPGPRPAGGDDETPPAAVDESKLSYDIEIYDARRLVYAGRQASGQTHVVGYELEPCQNYRWSVRPSYREGSDVTYGDWMRLPGQANADSKGRNGLTGRNASLAPAYTQDFPELEIKCGRRR